MHSGITLLVKLSYMPHNKCIFTHLHTCILDGQLCRFNSLHLPNASRPFLITLAHFVSLRLALHCLSQSTRTRPHFTAPGKARAENKRSRETQKTPIREGASARERCGRWKRAKEENKARVKESKSERGGARETFVSVFASRKGERERVTSRRSEEMLKRRMSYVLITHVRPIITLQGHPLTGKMKAALERQTLTPTKDNSFPPACSQAAVTNSGDARNTVSMEVRIPITTSSRAWCFI